MLRRLLAAALALAALASCGHAEPSARPAAAAALATPIAKAPLAPRWDERDVRALQAQLRDAFNASALTTSGIAIVDAAGRPLFERRDREAMTPASTFKLIVGATAMQTLGANFRFETTLESIDPPRRGVIHGPLYLVGSGDPTLTSDDLRGGIAALARAGVRKIEGDVVADATLFSGPEVNPQWDADDLQYGYAAGTSALSLDQGTAEFHVVPTVPGAPARVIVRPASDLVRVSGSITTSYATMLSITRDAKRDDFTLQGRVAVGAEQSFWEPVTQMPLYAAAVARAMLRQREIVVTGGERTGIAPVVPNVLWRHRSAPLRAIVRQMFLESNNHFAEQLLRAVGATRGAGTEASGALVERAMLARIDAPSDGLRVVDGSGLAPTDRVEPLTLAELLARTAAQPLGPIFVEDLPRVGIEGTVRYRQVTDARGRARAKSGHIDGVNALAGYVQTRRHGRVAFAIVVNDRRADDGPVDDGIDRALDILARY